MCLDTGAPLSVKLSFLWCCSVKFALPITTCVRSWQNIPPHIITPIPLYQPSAYCSRAFDKIKHINSRQYKRDILKRRWKRLDSNESDATRNDDVPMEIWGDSVTFGAHKTSSRINIAYADQWLEGSNFDLVWALLSDFSPIWQVFLNCLINTCTACHSYLCRVYHISNSTYKSTKFQERSHGRVNTCIDSKENSAIYVILHVQCTLLQVFQYFN